MIMKIEEKRNSLLKEFKRSLRDLRLIQQIDLLEENLSKIKDITMNTISKEKNTQRLVTKRKKAIIKKENCRKKELNDTNKNVMKWLDTLQDDADFIDKDIRETPIFQEEKNKPMVPSRKTPESLNIDSLLSSYKHFENKEEPLPPLIVFSDEEEDDEDVGNANEDANNNDSEIDKKVSKIKEILKNNIGIERTSSDEKDPEVEDKAANKEDVKEEASKTTIVPLMMSLSGLNGQTDSDGLAKKASQISARKSKKRNKPQPYLWDEKVGEEDNEKKKSYSNIRRDFLEPKGPTIRHKDQAMRILGIGSQMTETGAKAVPLSKYSQNDLVTAFQKKANEAQSNSQQLKNFHESYQVCQRVINSKKRFRAISKGAIKTEKFANLLTNLKQGSQTESNELDEKKNVNFSNAENTKRKLNFTSAALSLKKNEKP